MIRKRQVFATKWLSKITFIQLKFWNRKVIFVDRWCQKTLILICLASKNSYPQKLIKKIIKIRWRVSYILHIRDAGDA